MSDPRGGEPLQADLQARLRALAAEERCDLPALFDVSETVLARAIAGFSIKRASAKLIRAGIERAGREVAQGAAAGVRELPQSIVCHACLEIQARGENTGLPHTCEKATEP